jgi:AraC-like DNA-binding protein
VFDSHKKDTHVKDFRGCREGLEVDGFFKRRSLDTCETRVKSMLPLIDPGVPAQAEALAVCNIAPQGFDGPESLILQSSLAVAKADPSTPRTSSARLDCSAANEPAPEVASAQSIGRPIPSRRAPQELQKWRLRRVDEYVEAHIGETIRLADLAEAAGLTAMYFAAQFRARTSLRPHEYLVQQRVARAQLLLKSPQAKLCEVSLCVGFANQAHFTTVFRRYVGLTPRRWRSSQLVEH